MTELTTRYLLAIQASTVWSTRTRRRLLKLAGLRIGWATNVREHVFFGSADVNIGERCQVSVGCLMDGADCITIEDDVRLACNVSLITSAHEQGPASRRGGPLITAPVSIGKGCWLGANVTVLPGVSIAPGCVIGAGALVTKDTEPDGLYIGLPARRTRTLESNIGAAP